MVPIYEQGQGNGIGHSFDTLLHRFTDICNDHLSNGRAKAFAFLLYDFQDKNIKNILKNQGGFAMLDRLSGHDLSLFYLNSKDKHLLKQFNYVFLKAFDIDEQGIQLPLVLFFKIVDNEVADIEIVELEQNNLMFAFKELYDIVKNYIDRAKNESTKAIIPKTNKLKEFLRSAKKIAVQQFLKSLMDRGIEFGEKFI